MSVIRWLVFCPHHTAHPLVWLPGTGHHRSGPVPGWPRGLTPEVPFNSLTAASFYSTENQNCAPLPNSSQADGGVLPESSTRLALPLTPWGRFSCSPGGC